MDDVDTELERWFRRYRKMPQNLIRFQHRTRHKISPSIKTNCGVKRRVFYELAQIYPITRSLDRSCQPVRTAVGSTYTGQGCLLGRVGIGKLICVRPGTGSAAASMVMGNAPRTPQQMRSRMVYPLLCVHFLCVPWQKNGHGGLRCGCCHHLIPTVERDTDSRDRMTLAPVARATFKRRFASRRSGVFSWLWANPIVVFCGGVRCIEGLVCISI